MFLKAWALGPLGNPRKIQCDVLTCFGILTLLRGSQNISKYRFVLQDNWISWFCHFYRWTTLALILSGCVLLLPPLKKPASVTVPTPQSSQTFCRFLPVSTDFHYRVRLCVHDFHPYIMGPRTKTCLRKRCGFHAFDEEALQTPSKTPKAALNEDVKEAELQLFRLVEAILN